MSVMTRERSPLASAGEPAALDWIIMPDVHLALWRRSRPAALDWLDACDWDSIDDLDIIIPMGTLNAEFGAALEEAGYPQDRRGGALHDEIAALARRFAAIMGCEQLKIRLEVVETDACRKFHADAVTARLLVTLSGEGTDWIEADAPGHINRLSTGEVAIFKGRLWAEEPAILHRSPPIAGTGATRLLLAMDPVAPGKPLP